VKVAGGTVATIASGRLALGALLWATVGISSLLLQLLSGQL
jgi:hypothetical protein